MFALNVILITATELWALRYPDTHELHVLERAAGGPSGGRHLEHASARGTIRVRSGDLANVPAVVVASEPMDEDAGLARARIGRAAARRPGPDVTITTRSPSRRRSS